MGAGGRLCQQARRERTGALATAVVAEPRRSPPQPPVLAFDPPTAEGEAIVPEETAPVDGLKISSQYWRRGGLGSKALVTFTLRNTNDYAVKDIAISCAFSRQGRQPFDRSHADDSRHRQQARAARPSPACMSASSTSTPARRNARLVAARPV